MKTLAQILLLGLVLPLGGCAGDGAGAGDDDDDDGTPIVVTDLASYTAACEAALGDFPEFDCSEGVEIPITVTTGSTTIDVLAVSDLEGGTDCDRPLAVGGCIPHSRVATKTNATGSTYTFVCRAYEFRSPGNILYDDLGVIAQNPTTGDTCFWAVPIDGHTFDGSVIPRPGSPADAQFFPDRGFWYTLPEIAGATCMRCHDNDPYIHTPAIEQTGEVPSRPRAPYEVVARDVLNDLGGTSDWDNARVLAKPEAAPCLACHRLGERFTCGLARYAAGRDTSGVSASFRQFPRSHWMDSFDSANLLGDYPTEADWNVQFGAAVDAITDCCNDGSLPGCWEEL